MGRPAGRRFMVTGDTTMKLALKLALAFVLAMCVVLSVYAYTITRREIEMYATDTRQDQHVLGDAVALAVHHLWQSGGETAALDYVRQTNLREAPNQLGVRWVFVNSAQGGGESLALPRDAEAELRNGKELTSDQSDFGEVNRFHTLVPVAIPGAPLGAIEIGESLATIREFTHARILRVFVATGAVVALTAILATVLGFRFVGRPVSALMAHARSVAAGDLSTRLHFHQHDELRELAQELNAMSDQLAAARARVEAETAAKIATIEQLRHADRLATVGRLASGIAHELGTPLNVASARAKMILADRTSGDEIATNARIIVEQSERMTRIIRQLLEFARPRSPHRVRSDLHQLAQQTAALLRPIATERNVTIEVREGTPGLRAEIDPDQIRQVLSNLIQNAVQAMPKPGAVTVDIGIERVRPPADHGGPEDEYIRLAVQDEGKGISAETLPHVFEPFFTTKQVGEGTGLGLSVSRGIVLEHGGWIGVTSRVGQGSCFSVYLPRGHEDEE